MTRPTRHRAVSLVAGALAGAGLWWLGVDPAFAVAVGIAVVVAGVLLARTVRNHSGYTASDDWRDDKWAAAGVVFLTLVAFQALLWVPVSFEYRVGLHALVGVTWFVGFLAGGLNALERGSRGDRDGSEAGTVADPADD